jgi:putative transposase
MKKSKFTEAQIAFALRQSETGTRVEEICRQLGVSQATFFNWKKKYGGMGVAELRKLRQLEKENAQLKKLVADLSLDKQMLQDVIKKMRPPRGCEATLQEGNGKLARFQLPGFNSESLPLCEVSTGDVLL